MQQGDGLQEKQDFKETFVSQLHLSHCFSKLFNHLSDVYFFAKDLEGRFVLCNQLAAERSGCESEEDLIGKTDYDCFPADLAEKYINDDKVVMSTGKPIVNLPELAPDCHGLIEWVIVNKFPLYNKVGEIIGIMGTTQSLDQRKADLTPYLDISPAVEYIKKNYAENISIPNMAKLVGMSVQKFESKFKQIFHIPPKKYLVKTRILMACKKLLQTNESITNIALEVGFYDHSSFTHQFIKTLKCTPVKYRKRHQNPEH